MAAVFVSYCRENQPKARSLAEDIESLGHDAWFDQHLTGGQAWWNLILEEIRKCEVFAFALAPDSLESPACRREYTYAADLKKSILPVLISDGVSLDYLPEALAQIQFVDYRQEDKAAFRSLARALKALPLSPALPDPLPEPPPAPVSYLGSLREKVESQNVLSFEDQTGLVIRLKHGLREPKQFDDVIALLRFFRAREDLYARVADEIDALLAAEVRPPAAPIAPQVSPAAAPKTTEVYPKAVEPEVLPTAVVQQEPTATETTPPTKVEPQPRQSRMTSFIRRISVLFKYLLISLIAGISIAFALGAPYGWDSERILSRPLWGIPTALVLSILFVWKVMGPRRAYFKLLMIILTFLPAPVVETGPSYYYDDLRYLPWEPRLMVPIIPLLLVGIVFLIDRVARFWQTQPKFLRLAVPWLSLIGGLCFSVLLSTGGAFSPPRDSQVGLALLFSYLLMFTAIAKVIYWRIRKRAEKRSVALSKFKSRLAQLRSRTR
ncbi:MAG: toll/interleukin-1 receptor domain-containing protein [Acidobacteriota bacterium]